MTKNKLLLYLAALVLLLIILRLVPENVDLRIGPVKVLSLELWIAIFVMVSLSNKTSAFLGADMLWGCDCTEKKCPHYQYNNYCIQPLISHGHCFTVGVE